ncbi:MAG: glycosyltransferase family 4 protein [Acidimicrobiia bacterium]|nr:glycosyltransferase family 4 protein [Acidimicrobiia bacterium]
MRVLVISWEFPPTIVGGLGRHVDRLTEALVDEGHEVHILTRGAADRPQEEMQGRIHVHRVAEYPPVVPEEDLISWVLAFNLGLVVAGVQLLNNRQFDVIHAHDWLVAYAAADLQRLYSIPVVATVHATEYGRHQGWLPEPMNRLIHQVEWWLTYVARRVITCSNYMRDQVQHIFELPPAKLDVVPNGVALRMPEPAPGDTGAETLMPKDPDRPIVLFAGRLEYEKGVQTLIEAAPAILASSPHVRFVVAGDGTYGTGLRDLVDETGLADHFEFVGFMDSTRMPALYRQASVVVVPSIYEPFGIVALEAMAAHVPVIVGDTGGLRELVDHGTNGLRIESENSAELAGEILRVLDDTALADQLVAGGRRASASRSWRMIARRTAEIYAKAIREEKHLRETGEIEDRPPLRLVWDASVTYRSVVDRDDESDGDTAIATSGQD